MANTVAIVSVVSGATVAITVPFINAVLERQRLRWQGNQARLDELRGLVDAAVGDMVRAHDLIWDIATAVDAQADDETPDPRLGELSAELTKTYVAVKTLATRIGLRLGSEDEVAAAANDVEMTLAMADADVAQPLQRGERIDTGPLWSQRDSLGKGIGIFQDRVRDLIGPVRERR